MNGERVASRDLLYTDPLVPGRYWLTEADEVRGDVHQTLALWFVDPTGVVGRITHPFWTITENVDGTVTVAPSIWANKHGSPPGWHGFLESGIWRTV